MSVFYKQRLNEKDSFHSDTKYSACSIYFVSVHP